MSETRKELVAAIFFIALAAFIYIQSFAITMSNADSLGPQFFPRMVSVAMALLAIIQLVKNIDGFKASQEEKEKTGFSLNMPLLLTMALLVGYFLFLKTVGFILLTMIYLFCQIYLLLPKGSLANKKTLIASLVTSIVAPVGIYMLFYHGFMIFLPPGILG